MGRARNGGAPSSTTWAGPSTAIGATKRLVVPDRRASSTAPCTSGGPSAPHTSTVWRASSSTVRIPMPRM